MFFMSLSPATTLSDADKLAELRRHDQFREWYSLDDKRFCLVCGKIINGRQIQIAGGTQGNGPLRLSCPTERCNSIPMDWLLPTDELLALAETGTAEDHSTASPRVTDPGEGDGLPTQLPRPAAHLTQHYKAFVPPTAAGPNLDGLAQFSSSSIDEIS